MGSSRPTPWWQFLVYGFLIVAVVGVVVWYRIDQMHQANVQTADEMTKTARDMERLQKSAPSNEAPRKKNVPARPAPARLAAKRPPNGFRWYDSLDRTFRIAYPTGWKPINRAGARAAFINDAVMPEEAIVVTEGKMIVEMSLEQWASSAADMVLKQSPDAQLVESAAIPDEVLQWRQIYRMPQPDGTDLWTVQYYLKREDTNVMVTAVVSEPHIDVAKGWVRTMAKSSEVRDATE